MAMKNKYDVVVIGGGPAGLAAATAAAEAGARVLLIEREERLGGILKQCIHDGFGVIKYGEKLSGCEYATREIERMRGTSAQVYTLTFVSRIEKLEDGFKLTLVNEKGIEVVETAALVLATGCRERTAKQVAVHGTRPAGLLTAGTAQYYINIMGYLPGKKAVILGSGDIGLIMARRLTLEGAKVIGVFEAKSRPGGLARNIYQCLDDFGIPLHLSETVVKVHGRDRVCGVTVAKVDENMIPLGGTERFIACDSLIVSVGLIPENELAESLGVRLSQATGGAICDERCMTGVAGVYACGNALHVSDLADYVSESGAIAGLSAARDSVTKMGEVEPPIEIKVDENFGYVVPQRVRKSEGGEVVFFFRSRESRSQVLVKAWLGRKKIFSKQYIGLKPPEMERVTVDFSQVDLRGETTIEFRMEEI